MQQTLVLWRLWSIPEKEKRTRLIYAIGRALPDSGNVYAPRTQTEIYWRNIPLNTAGSLLIIMNYQSILLFLVRFLLIANRIAIPTQANGATTNSGKLICSNAKCK